MQTLDNFLTSISMQKLKTKAGINILDGKNNQTLRTVLARIRKMILLSDNDRSIER